MIAFAGDHREVCGPSPAMWEPICRELKIAPSSYWAHLAERADPAERSARAKRDTELEVEIRRVHEENMGVYGARKVWRQLVREGVAVGRGAVERLMRKLGLKGVVRGKSLKTKVSNKTPPTPGDLVNREFGADAPDRSWVVDFTYARTQSGFVFTAFVIDVFARKIVGWAVARRADAKFVMTALDQALTERMPWLGGNELVHHSDRGAQYLAFAYTERLEEAGLHPSVGSVGDSYAGALAETVVGLYKTDLIERRRPWKGKDDVEFATLEWVDWRKNTRLLGPIGYVPPADAETNFYARLETDRLAA